MGQGLIQFFVDGFRNPGGSGEIRIMKQNRKLLFVIEVIFQFFFNTGSIHNASDRSFELIHPANDLEQDAGHAERRPRRCAAARSDPPHPAPPRLPARPAGRRRVPGHPPGRGAIAGAWPGCVTAFVLRAQKCGQSQAKAMYRSITATCISSCASLSFFASACIRRRRLIPVCSGCVLKQCAPAFST